jgi:hypothetical protein
MREKPFCSMGLYILADRAILPTNAQTPSRFTIAIEPVQVFDYHDKNDFLAAMKIAVERGYPSVPDPPDKELIFHADGVPGFKNPPVLKYASVESWDDLERTSIFVSIECFPSQYLIQSWGHGADRKWSDEKLLELRLPADVQLDVVVNAILDHLKNRRDLPGLDVSPFRPRTAKGA